MYIHLYNGTIIAILQKIEYIRIYLITYLINQYLNQKLYLLNVKPNKLASNIKYFASIQ